MGDNKKQKPMLYYYVMTLLVIMFINTYVVPTFFSPKVNELSYGNFIQMVDDGKFSKVEITDKRIAALGKVLTNNKFMLPVVWKIPNWLNA